MTGEIVALDTNEAIAVLNDTGDAAAWVSAYPIVCLPIIVVGELRFGALNSARADTNMQRVDGLVKRCRILEVTLATTEVYCRVRLQLKREGKPIPENDVWIAALAVQHGLPLATSDAHFDHVRGLTVIRRSTPS